MGHQPSEPFKLLIFLAGLLKNVRCKDLIIKKNRNFNSKSYDICLFIPPVLEGSQLCHFRQRPLHAQVSPF